MPHSVTATASAQNTFTSALTPSTHFDPLRERRFNVSVSGTFTATVSLQRSFDSGSTWHNIETYTAPTEKIADDIESGVQYRLGVETGNYTSGSAVLRLSL